RRESDISALARIRIGRIPRLQGVDACRNVSLKFELVGVLRDAREGGWTIGVVVEYDDGEIPAVSAAVIRRSRAMGPFVDERVLQHGIELRSVGRHRQPFEAAI